MCVCVCVCVCACVCVRVRVRVRVSVCVCVGVNVCVKHFTPISFGEKRLPYLEKCNLYTTTREAVPSSPTCTEYMRFFFPPTTLEISISVAKVASLTYPAHFSLCVNCRGIWYMRDQKQADRTMLSSSSFGPVRIRRPDQKTKPKAKTA